MEQSIAVSRRNVVIGGAVVLALLIGAFFAGRFSGPEKTVEVEKEKVVTKVEWKEKVVEKVVTVTEKAKTENKIVYVDRVITREGEIREKIVERVVEVEKERSDTEANKDKDSSTDTSSVVNKETEKSVTLRPDWRVGVMVGAQHPQPFLPVYGPLVLGAYGERRIIGGFSMGVWFQTGIGGGVTASMEF